MPDRSGWDRKPGFDLTGKTALVVGAETEAGAAVARALAEEGASVADVAATGKAGQWAQLQQELSSDRAGDVIDTWDIRNPNTVADAYSRLASSSGVPTILITAQDERRSALVEQ